MIVIKSLMTSNGCQNKKSLSTKEGRRGKPERPEDQREPLRCPRCINGSGYFSDKSENGATT